MKTKGRVRPIYFACSRESILETGEACEDQLARALYFFLYLTGARINEATDFQRSRIEFFSSQFKIRLKTLKQRQPQYSYRYVYIPRGKKAKCFENEMWEHVWKYIRGFELTEKPFKKWKNMSEYLARKISIQLEAIVNVGPKKWEERTLTKRFHPHLSRHFRATHLSQYYRWNVPRLCDFFGWRKPEMALIYVNLFESGFD